MSTKEHPVDTVNFKTSSTMCLRSAINSTDGGRLSILDMFSVRPFEGGKRKRNYLRFVGSEDFQPAALARYMVGQTIHDTWGRDPGGEL